MKNYPRLILSISIVLFSLSLAVAQENQGVRRIGVFVGANDGGNQRVQLKWAVSDARRFASTLQEVGGLSTSDTQLLIQPRPSDIMGALKALVPYVANLQQQSRRVEFVFYYSGHSDENGLLMGYESLSYSQLRKAITEVGGDVSIAILDSCASGAFTRQKGGLRVQPFLVDETSNMKGYAYLTSSSENEASQESDVLMASFFTHFMISGLRGAADNSGDGRVTLNEAYQFAFNETLARTENTRAGPQHPNYDIQLKGSGDLILSDLTLPSASIILSESLNGRFFVRDSRGQLIAEVTKASGRSITLALVPGTYSIRFEKTGQIMEASFTVASRSQVSISNTLFSPRTAMVNRSRGNNPEDTTTSNYSELEQAIIQSIQDANLSNIDIDAPTTSGQGVLEGNPSSGIINPDLSKSILLNEPANDSSLMPNSAINLMITPGLSTLPSDTSYETSLTFGLVLAASTRNKAFAFGTLGHIASGDVSGVSIGGLFTTIEGNVEGVSLSGLFSYSANDFAGLEFSGLFNINNGNFSGVQISTLFNINGGNVSGVQAGLFNFSGGTVTGVQIGLLNYANSMEGIPIGLISFVADGIHEISVGYTLDSSTFGISFTNGTKYTYSRFLVNIDLVDGADGLAIEALESGFAIGLRLGDPTLHLDIEAGLRHLGHADVEVGDQIITAFDYLAPHALPDIVPMINTTLTYSIEKIFGIWISGGLDLVTPQLISTSRYLTTFNDSPWGLQLSNSSDPSSIFIRFSFGVSLAF